MPIIEVIIIKDEKLKNTSFGTFQTCRNVFETILSKYKDTKASICKDEDDLQDVVKRKPDLVVLTNKIMVTNSGKKIWLSEYFQIHNINFTGSSKEILKYDVNKISSKLQVLSHGVETARFFTAIPEQYKLLDELPIQFPLFVKPANAANSDGIDRNSFVVSFAGFQTKVKELYSIYKEPVLVEEYLSGREFTVSIIQADTMLVAPIEIIAPLENDIRILSKEIKSKDKEALKEITDINIYKKISKIAILAFKALGARDFGRIDIKMDAHERCYFIEANLTPGMTRGSSYFPLSYELSSLIQYDEVLTLIVQSALKRNDLIEVYKKIIKIDKYIEIVMIEGDIKQKNIAIDIDARKILEILDQHYTKVAVSVIRTEDDLQNLINKKPDLIFSGVKYFSFCNEENNLVKIIWLNDYLDKHNISYIGSNREALENEYNKASAKKIMQKSNVSTANFFTAYPGEYKNAQNFPVKFPLFVKPVIGGDSRGIDQNSIVNNFQEFEDKVLSIHNDYNAISLIESYLPGSEYSVSILENQFKNTITAMPVEIIPELNNKKHAILDYDTKQDDSEQVVSVLNIEIRNKISALAIIAFKALNGKSFGRVDIKMDKEGVPYFIEANLMPGLKEGYFYKACLLNQNINYEEMILLIADTGLSSKKIQNKQLRAA